MKRKSKTTRTKSTPAELARIRVVIETEERRVNPKLVKLRADYIRVVDKLLDSSKDLQDALKRVESSNELGSDDNGVYAWTRFDSDAEISADDIQGYLDRKETYVRFDEKNCALCLSLGPCIVINHEGDILDEDSGKWIIPYKEYETVKERNRLIEAWMERTGHFPSVVRQDFHGNTFYVDTKGDGS